MRLHVCVCTFKDFFEEWHRTQTEVQGKKEKKGVTERKVKNENMLVIKLDTDTFLLAKKQLETKP